MGEERDGGGGEERDGGGGEERDGGGEGTLPYSTVTPYSSSGMWTLGGNICHPLTLLSGVIMWMREVLTRSFSNQCLQLFP